MIKTITICDRCGKEIGDNGTQVFGIDLCDKCAQEASKLVLSWVKPDNRKGPLKRWDKGRAQSLRNAGWKLEDIAKECGVTESTICKHTTAPVLKKARPNEWAQSEPDLPTALST